MTESPALDEPTSGHITVSREESVRVTEPVNMNKNALNCSGKFSSAPQRRSRLRCGRRGGPDGDPAGVHADHARDQDSCPRASNPPRHLRRSREGRRQKDKEKPDEATRRTDADGPEDEGGTGGDRDR